MSDAGRTPGDSPGQGAIRKILQEVPELTAEDLVDGTDVSPDLARRLWRALGFPDAGTAAAFTAGDREAITMLTGLVDSGQVDVDTAVRLTRALGHTMARLADWQVSTFTDYLEDFAEPDTDPAADPAAEPAEQERTEEPGEGQTEPGTATGTAVRLPSTLAAGLNALVAVEPTFEQLLTYAWRRHLAAAVGRVEALAGTEQEMHAVTLTVGFADLVSFTRLSSGIGEERLAELVETFETMCADLVAARGGQLIKTIGDSVLFVAEEPRVGVDIAADIVARIGAVPELPDVHVGIATGAVVLRLGDVFGGPVNLASRLTGVARRNRVVCDVTTADAVREDRHYALRSLTERLVRGIGRVQPYTVRRVRRG